MKKGMEFIGVILIIQGVAGLVHEFTGWFGLWTIVGYLPFLEGYEVFANIVLAVIGFGVAALGSVASPSASRT